MGPLDGVLAGLIGGGRAAPGDEVQNGIHPAAALAGAGGHQALRVTILPPGKGEVMTAFCKGLASTVGNTLEIT